MNTEKTSIFDYFSQLVALTASASLVASLAYDWGFFYTIGISFHDLPTSLSDHARTALDWAPTVAAGAFFYLFFELLTRRIEQGKTEAEILATSSNPGRLRKFRESPWVLAWIFIIGCPISYAMLGDAELEGLKV
ncbi:MAG: hypothetical protein LBV73_04080 [Paraburkholderia sp.]|jgi:hypothetical protein|nr:hypothetical protein [Paraburkholderia sp.]